MTATALIARESFTRFPCCTFLNPVQVYELLFRQSGIATTVHRTIHPGREASTESFANIELLSPRMKYMPSFTTQDLDALWENYGSGMDTTVRQKLVILSALEIAKQGTLEFNAKTPCVLIGAKTSIVNYYFGGREGLMAEAAAFVHDEWFRLVNSLISRKAVDPEKQLKQLINVQLDFATKWREMAVFASYPNSSPLIRKIYFERFGQHTKDIFEYYLAVITQLIDDARSGKKSVIDFELGNVPKHKARKMASSLLAATSFSWSVHGLFVWTAGQHAPSQKLEDKKVSSLTETFAVKYHINTIIDAALRK